MTFNTPVGAKLEAQCGRVVYSDYHIVADQTVTSAPFPSECFDVPLTATERVLEFMLFDLQTCIQAENEYPRPPIAR